MKKLLLIIALWSLSFTVKGQTFEYESDSCYYYYDVNIPSFVTYAIHYDVTLIRVNDTTTLYITSKQDKNNCYVLRIDSLLTTRSERNVKMFVFKSYELNLKTLAVVSFLYRNGDLKGIGVSDEEALLVWDVKPKIKLKDL